MVWGHARIILLQSRTGPTNIRPCRNKVESILVVFCVYGRVEAVSLTTSVSAHAYLGMLIMTATNDIFNVLSVDSRRTYSWCICSVRHIMQQISMVRSKGLLVQDTVFRAPTRLHSV